MEPRRHRRHQTAGTPALALGGMVIGHLAVRGLARGPSTYSVLCMPSTYEKDGERRSRVVLNPPGGTIATVPRTYVMYAVTEYGMVCLKGKSVAERAMAMISIAHPDSHESPEREAYGHGLIPKAYFQ